MSLTRREILEQLKRLGVKQFSLLKKTCRDFERYWEELTNQDQIKVKRS